MLTIFPPRRVTSGADADPVDGRVA